MSDDDEAVTTWIEGYVRAWNSNDPDDIAALFTDDAVYATEPYHAPWIGRERIVSGWIEHQDEPGETRFEWSPVVITPDVAVVRGTTHYPESTYSNLWVVRLAGDGRCAEFSEWWMEHPRS